MQTTLHPRSNIPILECTDQVTVLTDALELVSATYENNTHRVLLRDRQLPSAFFELHTRFAGEFIQKLVNYRISVACVFEGTRAYSDRFRDYMEEAARGHQFRAFDNEAQAIEWLEKQ